jgi:hypothetical protein
MDRVSDLPWRLIANRIGLPASFPKIVTGTVDFKEIIKEF